MEEADAENVVRDAIETSYRQDVIKSHISHDARLYLFQLRRELIPHLLLDFGSFRATN